MTDPKDQGLAEADELTETDESADDEVEDAPEPPATEAIGPDDAQPATPIEDPEAEVKP